MSKMNAQCPATANGLIVLFVGTVVTLSTLGNVTFGTLVPLTITVMINVLFGPGLAREERRLDDEVHNGNLLNSINLDRAIGGVGKQCSNNNGAEIVECIVSQRNDNRHGSRR